MGSRAAALKEAQSRRRCACADCRAEAVKAGPEAGEAASTASRATGREAIDEHAAAVSEKTPAAPDEVAPVMSDAITKPVAESPATPTKSKTPNSAPLRQLQARRCPMQARLAELFPACFVGLSSFGQKWASCPWLAVFGGGLVNFADFGRFCVRSVPGRAENRHFSHWSS